MKTLCATLVLLLVGCGGESGDEPAVESGKGDSFLGWNEPGERCPLGDWSCETGSTCFEGSCRTPAEIRERCMVKGMNYVDGSCQLPPETCRASGLVVNGGGIGLGGLTVELVALSQFVKSPWFYRTISDDRGRFSFDSVACDQRFVSVIQPDVRGSGSGSGHRVFYSRDQGLIYDLNTSPEIAITVRLLPRFGSDPAAPSTR